MREVARAQGLLVSLDSGNLKNWWDLVPWRFGGRKS
jgi:hypothetical protein